MKEKLKDKSNFVVYTELTGGPGFNCGPIEEFLKSYKDAGTSVIPKGIDFVGITLTQNPGGVANIEPADVISRLRLKDQGTNPIIKAPKRERILFSGKSSLRIR